MSGHKRAFVRLSRAEYERLRDAAAEQRLATSPAAEPAPAQAAAILSQSSSAVWDDLEAVHSRQNALEDLLLRCDDQVRSLEHQTGQVLLGQQQALAEDLQHAAGQLSRRTEALLDDHLRTFRQEVTRAVREARSSAMAMESSWQRQVNDRQRSQQQAAEPWMDAALSIASFIRTNYLYELLTPGLVDQAEQGLRMAEENQRAGMHEAALASAQQAYLRLSELRLELERLESQRRILTRAAEESLRTLAARAQAARSLPAVDLDGQELDVRLDVDFWSGGGLSQLQADLQALLGLLATPLDIPALESIHTALPEMDARLAGLIETARLAVINSQLRYDIAEVVVSALSEQGFALEEGAYAAGDAREGYCVRLVNAEGGLVDVHISPRPGEALENDLHLLSHDAEARTRHELRARMHELTRSLAWHGLDVGQSEQLPAQASNSRQDQRQPTRERLHWQKAAP